MDGGMDGWFYKGKECSQVLILVICLAVVLWLLHNHQRQCLTWISSSVHVRHIRVLTISTQVTNPCRGKVQLGIQIIGNTGYSSWLLVSQWLCYVGILIRSPYRSIAKMPLLSRIRVDTDPLESGEVHGRCSTGPHGGVYLSAVPMRHITARLGIPANSSAVVITCHPVG